MGSKFKNKLSLPLPLNETATGTNLLDLLKRRLNPFKLNRISFLGRPLRNINIVISIHTHIMRVHKSDKGGILLLLLQTVAYIGRRCTARCRDDSVIFIQNG